MLTTKRCTKQRSVRTWPLPLTYASGAGTGAWRVDLDSLKEEQLAEFGDVEMREKGMVGAAMGTTALSASGRWWAIPVKAGPVSRFVLIDTDDRTSDVFLERDTIG